MNISEVISRLSAMQAKYGDLRVCDDRDWSFGDFEYVPEDGGVIVFDLNNDDNE